MQASQFSMRLEQTYLIAPQVRQFVLLCPDVSTFTYIPGQFITLHFEFEGKQYKRSYSIANPPSSTGRIEFAASYVENGPASIFLFNLQPGASLQMSGPYGRLILKEPMPHRYILIGTGTGVTPYRAMRAQLEAQLAAQEALEVILVQGARTREDLLFASEFRDWAARCSRVKFLACLSRHGHGELLTDERGGHVQQCFSDLNLDPAKDTVYLCGNPKMIDESFDLLTQHGFTVSQLIREKYISQGK